MRLLFSKIRHFWRIRVSYQFSNSWKVTIVTIKKKLTMSRVRHHRKNVISSSSVVCIYSLEMSHSFVKFSARSQITRRHLQSRRLDRTSQLASQIRYDPRSRFFSLVVRFHLHQDQGHANRPKVSGRHNIETGWVIRIDADHHVDATPVEPYLPHSCFWG